jgi:hypothetical protein
MFSVFRIKLLIFCLVFVFTLKTNAQIKYRLVNDLVLESKFIYGSILPHYASMNYLVDEYQKGFEIQ